MQDQLRTAIRSIPDFPKPGIVFKDITTLLADPEAFRETLNRFEAFCLRTGATRIAAIDSRGFIFGGALADRLKIPLTLVRKKGKLPFKTIREDYTLEYGVDSLEMHVDSAQKGDRVMIIDDLLATGGTLLATCSLVKRLGADVAGIAVLIELSFLKGRERLAGFEVLSLVDYESE
jgi:adenine phosphoribosyltransferase